MIIPFGGITISRDVAKKMKQEINKFCLATRDVAEMRRRYRGEHPTPEQSLDLYCRENDKQLALITLTKLVLENVIDDNF